MVSFFGLKFGDKKRKPEKPDGGTLKSQAAQEKKSGKNLQCEQQCFGLDPRDNQSTDVVKTSSRPGSSISKRSSMHGRKQGSSFVGGDAGSNSDSKLHDAHSATSLGTLDISNIKSVPLAGSPRLTASSSEVRLATAKCSNTSAKRSVGGGTPQLAAARSLEFRPGTTHGQGSKTWVNPLDVHFMKESPSAPSPAWSRPFAQISGEVGGAFAAAANEAPPSATSKPALLPMARSPLGGHVHNEASNGFVRSRATSTVTAKVLPQADALMSPLPSSPLAQAPVAEMPANTIVEDETSRAHAITTDDTPVAPQILRLPKSPLGHVDVNAPEDGVEANGKLVYGPKTDVVVDGISERHAIRDHVQEQEQERLAQQQGEAACLEREGLERQRATGAKLTLKPPPSPASGLLASPQSPLRPVFLAGDAVGEGDLSLFPTCGSFEEPCPVSPVKDGRPALAGDPAASSRPADSASNAQTPGSRDDEFRLLLSIPPPLSPHPALPAGAPRQGGSNDGSQGSGDRARFVNGVRMRAGGMGLRGCSPVYGSRGRPNPKVAKGMAMKSAPLTKGEVTQADLLIGSGARLNPTLQGRESGTSSMTCRGRSPHPAAVEPTRGSKEASRERSASHSRGVRFDVNGTLFRPTLTAHPLADNATPKAVVPSGPLCALPPLLDTMPPLSDRFQLTQKTAVRDWKLPSPPDSARPSEDDSGPTSSRDTARADASGAEPEAPVPDATHNLPIGQRPRPPSMKAGREATAPTDGANSSSKPDTPRQREQTSPEFEAAKADLGHDQAAQTSKVPSPPTSPISLMSPATGESAAEPFYCASDDETYSRPVVQNIRAKRDTMAFMTDKKQSLITRIETFEQSLVAQTTTVPSLCPLEEDSMADKDSFRRRSLSLDSSFYSCDESYWPSCRPKPLRVNPLDSGHPDGKQDQDEDDGVPLQSQGRCSVAPGFSFLQECGPFKKMKNKEKGEVLPAMVVRGRAEVATASVDTLSQLLKGGPGPEIKNGEIVCLSQTLTPRSPASDISVYATPASASFWPTPSQSSEHAASRPATPKQLRTPSSIFGRTFLDDSVAPAPLASPSRPSPSNWPLSGTVSMSMTQSSNFPTSLQPPAHAQSQIPPSRKSPGSRIVRAKVPAPLNFDFATSPAGFRAPYRGPNEPLTAVPAHLGGLMAPAWTSAPLSAGVVMGAQSGWPEEDPGAGIGIARGLSVREPVQLNAPRGRRDRRLPEAGLKDRFGTGFI